MNPLRLVLGLAVVSAAIWLALSLFVHAPPPSEPARAFQSSRQCAECHGQVYAEWEASWHARAWTDPEVRALSNDFANTDCIDCHAPRPVLETGLANRVLPRTARRVEGVDCLTCHTNADGSIAGTLDSSSAACRPVATRDLVQPEFCAPCHDQHLTVQQWKATPFAAAGPGFQSCVDCHMPYRGGDPALGRDHTMHGGHDLGLLQRAVRLGVTRQDGRPVVEVENVGAGHNFPTDERSRAADVFWRPLAEGSQAGPWRHLHRFRNPYRYEVGLENTELPFGSTVRLPIEDAAARDAAVEVALFYKLSPYWADPQAPQPEREATLVHRVESRP